MVGKYRAQILLEPEQHAALVRLAENQGHSISEAARQVIQIGLAVLNNDVDMLWERRLGALESLGQIRESVQRRYGVYHGDLVAEARAERARQDELVLKPEPGE